MGDFNCAADRFTPLLSGMRDSFRVAFPQPDTDEATFNGWKPVITGERIDWIVASPQFQTLDAEIGRRMPDGRFPSDHWSVMATLQLAPVPK